MIVCVGDIMLDVLLLPELRAAEQEAGILVRPGGSAANTAAWSAKLGARVGFVGCIGDDPAGSLLESDLAERGIESLIRRIHGASTGCVAVEITDDGQRIMRSSRAANNQLDVEDVARIAGVSPKIVHVTGYSLLGPLGLELLAGLYLISRENEALLSFDPSSTTVIQRLGRERLLEALAEVKIDLLLPNREEAEALSGTGDVEESARRLLRYVPRVAIKKGEDGALAAGATGMHYVAADRVECVDVTGAGDAFNAGVLVGLAGGADLKDAAIAGVRTATKAIGTYGGRPALD